MPRYFMEGTPLSGFEKMMMQPPNFRVRGGGRNNSYQYTASDCDCRYCIKAEREKTPCQRASDCICFEERLTANCWTHGELAECFSREIAEEKLIERVLRVIPPHSRFPYKNLAHRRRVIGIRETGKDFAPHLAVTFLLSADSGLWQKAKKSMYPGGINFNRISERGLGSYGCILLQTAKDIYQGRCHISISLLCDPDRIEDDLFRLLISAFVIKRYGLSGSI